MIRGQLISTRTDTLFPYTTLFQSSAAVGVSTTSSASRRSLTVTVTGVAATHQLGYANAAGLSDVVTGASTKVRLDRFDGSPRSEEHTSELQSLMRISYAVFCLIKQKPTNIITLILSVIVNTK